MMEHERRDRRVALFVLGVMMLIFMGLSAVSFLGARNPAVPQDFSFGNYDAVEGKRVFQSYNCMGCHTLVGNGAYFAPDLTHVHDKAGPAWLAAFLPSAASWPTEAALRTQLSRLAGLGLIDGADLETYYATYPGARERVARRGGHTTLMPNLPLSQGEVEAVIAFLAYTSALNTEGWPPEILVNAPAAPLGQSGAPSSAPAATVGEGGDPIALGRSLSLEYGCASCHAFDGSRVVGPGWGGLYGSNESLTDGRTVVVDEAYLEESILDPNAKVVAGYASGIMPPYDAVLKRDELDAIIAFIKSLEGE